MNTRQWAKNEIENIQRVAAEIEKQPAAGLFGDKSPGKIVATFPMRWAGVTVSHAGDRSQLPGVHDLLRFGKPRQPAAVVRDEQRGPRCRKPIDHSYALG